MGTSTERMRRHRAKLKLEETVLRCLDLGVDPAVILADVKLTIQCADRAGMVVRHVDRSDVLRAA